jgi:hypothetical protein
MAQPDAISGNYGHSSSSVDYGHKYTPQSKSKSNIFSQGNDEYLKKVLERNGGIVPIGTGAISH